ncbi:MAG: hypothetical protein ACRDSJ_01155 [Rubrobacteraceae bacterium]
MEQRRSSGAGLLVFAIAVAGVALVFAPDEVTARYIEPYLLALAVFVVLFVAGGVIGGFGGKSGDGAHYGDWYDGDSGGGD